MACTTAGEYQTIDGECVTNCLDWADNAKTLEELHSCMCEDWDWLPVANDDGTKTCVKQECSELSSWNWFEQQCVVRPSCKHDEWFLKYAWYFTCVEVDKCDYRKPWSIDGG